MKRVDTGERGITIKYLRNNAEYRTNLKLVFEDNMYKAGLYIKDKIVGIGTLTFIDLNNKFAALGHQIIEKNTEISSENLTIIELK